MRPSSSKLGTSRPIRRGRGANPLGEQHNGEHIEFKLNSVLADDTEMLGFVKKEDIPVGEDRWCGNLIQLYQV